MGVHPTLAVCFYIDGIGVYLHRLYVERYKLTPGSTITREVMEHHNSKIPLEERSKMTNWIHPEDKEILDRSSKAEFYKQLVSWPQKEEVLGKLLKVNIETVRNILDDFE